MQRDKPLMELIQQLSRTVAGYPFNLQLVTGSLSYVPNRHSIDELKASLKAFICRAEIQSFLARGNEVEDDGASLKVHWHIAWKELLSQENGWEAVNVFKILAYCGAKSSRFGDLDRIFERS